MELKIELPTVLSDSETRSLVITGTDRYDEMVIPDEAENAVALDVQDGQFYISVYIPLLYRDGEPLKTYLPAYIDRTDKKPSVPSLLSERARERRISDGERG